MNTFENELTKAPARYKSIYREAFSDFPEPLRIVVTGKKELVYSARPDKPTPATPPGQPKPENPNPNPKPETPRPVTKEEPGKAGYTLPGDKPREPGDKPLRPVEKNKGIETAPKQKDNDEEEDEEYDDDADNEGDEEYELNEDNNEKEFDEREDTAF